MTRTIGQLVLVGGLVAALSFGGAEAAPALVSLLGIAPGVVGGFIGKDNNNTVMDHYGTIAGGRDNWVGNDLDPINGRPYATVSGGLSNEATGTSSTVAGGLDNAAGGNWSAVGGGANNLASRDYATVAGGSTNAASGDYATVAGGTINMARGEYATVGGGARNEATGHSSTVGGGFDSTAGAQSATVGGGYSNIADREGTTIGGGIANVARAVNATVAGGKWNEARGESATVGGGENNHAIHDYATIGGGGNNVASFYAGTVGGGFVNVASGDRATIGGGGFNEATGGRATVAGGQSNGARGNYSAVGGGHNSQATGPYATIAGGASNQATANYSTVPGGVLNAAGGNFSLAAGRQAKANHSGTFVWGDASPANVASTGSNQFVVRASGGIWLGTTSAVSIPAGRFIQTSTGAYLSSTGIWTNNSDRALKENLVAADGRAVLDRLVGLPVYSWHFAAESPSVGHIGPMAQDFAAAFGVGADTTHIATVDADGVALAAIQGLHHLLQEKDAEIASLRAEVATKDAALSARLDAVERRGAATGVASNDGATLGLLERWAGAVLGLLGGFGAALIVRSRRE